MVMATACAGDQPDSEADVLPVEPMTGITSAQQVSRPIDAWQLDVEELLALSRIEQGLVQQCLDRRGINATYLADPNARAYIEQSRVDEVRLTEMWGFYDPDNAQRWGYHQDPSVPPVGATGFRGDVPEDIGTSCIQEAWKTMPGGMHWASLIGKAAMPEDGPANRVDHPVMTEGLQEWSACVEKAGYHFDHPVDAALSFDLDGPITSEEIATAMVDMQCKDESNLVGRGLAVLTAYDQAYIDKHRSELEEYRRNIDTFIREHGR